MNAVAEIEVQTPLDAIREQIATERSTLAKLEAERRRCADSIEQNQKIVDAEGIARAALTELHTRKAAGERVTDSQIAQGEENVRNASVMADRARFAIDGARAATRKFEEQCAPHLTAIAQAQATARQVIASQLVDMAEAARRDYKQAATAFATGPHAHFHAIINSIALMAQKLGFTDVLQVAIPCAPSGLPEFTGTGTTRDPFALFTVDARAAIASATPAIAEELRQLTEGL
jgi:hypothetical protein